MSTALRNRLMRIQRAADQRVSEILDSIDDFSEEELAAAIDIMIELHEARYGTVKPTPPGKLTLSEDHERTPYESIANLKRFRLDDRERRSL